MRQILLADCVSKINNVKNMSSEHLSYLKIVKIIGAISWPYLSVIIRSEKHPPVFLFRPLINNWVFALGLSTNTHKNPGFIIIQELLCHQSQQVFFCICLPPITMNIFILDGELSCLWGWNSRVSSAGGVQSINLLSVSCKASALSSTFCHGHGEWRQLSPCASLSHPQCPLSRGQLHPKVFTIHGLEPRREPLRWWSDSLSSDSHLLYGCREQNAAHIYELPHNWKLHRH